MLFALAGKEFRLEEERRQDWKRKKQFFKQRRKFTTVFRITFIEENSLQNFKNML